MDQQKSSKAGVSPSTQASAETQPPATGRRPITTTGNTNGKKTTPILAEGKDAPSTEARSDHAPDPSEYASITTAALLALLQTDLSDLQSRGYSMVILAKEGSLYLKIAPPENNTLGWSEGEITLNGRKVKEG